MINLEPFQDIKQKLRLSKCHLNDTFEVNELSCIKQSVWLKNTIRKSFYDQPV